MPSDPFAPPRPELLALLDAIKDHPDDDTPRLVLADWLDERDNALDAERARFIRADITRGRELQTRSRTRAEVDEADALLPQWLGPVANLGGGLFVRGLPQLTISGPRLLKPDAPALLATEAFAFVQFVNLHEAGGPRMEAMAAMPEFRFVPGVSLHPFSAFGADSAARFFASPNVSGLRRIEFRSVKPGVVGMHALAANPALGRLRKLSLAHNKLVDKAVAALAADTHLANLYFLDLSDNNIGDAGAEALAASPTLANLRELDLHENPRLTDAGKQLLRAKFGDRVKLDD
jgi:uncharacterized protein (TIGR02996 family)